MKYNLTAQQKDLARRLVRAVNRGDLPETFCVMEAAAALVFFDLNSGRRDADSILRGMPLSTMGTLDALAESKLLLRDDIDTSTHQFTLLGLIYTAVDSNFTDGPEVLPLSSVAQPHPPEISLSLDRLRARYPDPKMLGLLIMRFTPAKPFGRIVEAVKSVGQQHGLSIVRADENQFHADLWGNVRTLLHGCGFGIAVYERIETEEPNANVGLEVGYLMAMNKPVLLLKDQTIGTLQADLAGKLYKEFDPHDPEGTIPGQLAKWLEDNGIIVPKAT